MFVPTESQNCDAAPALQRRWSLNDAITHRLKTVSVARHDDLSVNQECGATMWECETFDNDYVLSVNQLIARQNISSTSYSRRGRHAADSVAFGATGFRCSCPHATTDFERRRLRRRRWDSVGTVDSRVWPRSRVGSLSTETATFRRPCNYTSSSTS